MERGAQMYISTRGGGGAAPSAVAITAGIAPDGGLYSPETLPQLSLTEILSLSRMTYAERAAAILRLLLTDFSMEELAASTQEAYGEDRFAHPTVAPLVQTGGRRLLELWHGPTCAFKDMALQLLPHLLAKARGKTGETGEIVILVATSGDTGKAALEGFRDVSGTRMVVFYPYHGVSEVQELQMVTQEGANVAVVAVTGNFDDAQSGVKQIFNSQTAVAQLNTHGFRLSSANSINWGRLTPQIVYYFSAYADAVHEGAVKAGEPVNFAIPTGNFGNILAGYYAKRMGLPVGRLICAANSNNVLTDFLRTGVYDRQRPFFKTISPSMDILISSNLERLLFHASDLDGPRVARWMNRLASEGRYEVEPEVFSRIAADFWSGWADDAATSAAIQKVFADTGYLLDPHTAVAWQVADDYREATADCRPVILVSTANPFKFSESVLASLTGRAGCATGLAALKELSAVTGWPVPAPLSGLAGKPVLHRLICSPAEMPEVLEKLLYQSRNFG